MFLDCIEVNERQEDYCRKWLRQWYKAENRLTDVKLFPESVLIRMLKLEFKDRQRGHILRRLEARYNLLRRRRERTEMNQSSRRPIFTIGRKGEPDEGEND